MKPHIRLITTTLNEALTLPALAKGCKEMGVDSFLILDDDDSTDGTEEVAYREFAAVDIPGKVINMAKAIFVFAVSPLKVLL